jgi:hypothetical protein
MAQELADQDAAIEALQKAAADLKCLVCGYSRFECVDFAGENPRTSINFHQIASGIMSACANYGFVIGFVEPTLAEHASERT